MPQVLVVCESESQPQFNPLWILVCCPWEVGSFWRGNCKIYKWFQKLYFSYNQLINACSTYINIYDYFKSIVQ